MLARIRANYASVAATLALLVAIGGGVAIAGGGGTPDNRLRQREVVVKFSDPTSAEWQSVEAKCPGKKKVIGGGASSTRPQLSSIGESRPRLDDRWMAQAHEHVATSNPWSVIAYAICARAD